MEEPAGYWLQRARWTRRKINCGWCLQLGGTPVVVVALALLGPALWARRMWPQQALVWLGWIAAAALAACLAAAWCLARRRFVDETAALVRMESRMNLHSRLSAAQAGACGWPAASKRVDDGVRWSHANAWWPFVAAAAFLAAAFALPVKARVRPAAPDEPSAWTATEQDARDLAREQAADPQSLQEIHQRVAELRAQDAGQWFSHASLEATDQMREAHVRSLAELQRQLTHARQAMSRLAENHDPQLSAQARAALQDRFNQALQGMQAGQLKPHPELLDHLRQIDPKHLGQLDAAELARLVERMQANAQALAECLGDGEPGELALADGDGDAATDIPGMGAPTRGPGTSNDLFGDDATDLAAQKPQLLENPDPAQALPGDVLEVTDSQHDVNRTRSSAAGGNADLRGGGASTWHESLNPREQEAIKKFFE